MTNTKFIALLNLYLDHQIEPRDVALLEAEISRNPARREIYRQYCRMHKGCEHLAETFREQAPAPRISARHLQQVRPAPATRRFAPWAMGLGGLAAAASLTLLVVTRPSEPAAPLMAATSAAEQVAPGNPPAPSAQPILRLPAPVATTVSLQTVFNPARTETIALPEAQESVLFADEQFDRFDWMHHVQMTPVQLDEYHFQVRPALGEDRQRTFRSRKPFQGNVEMTAFQFQR